MGLYSNSTSASSWASVGDGASSVTFTEDLLTALGSQLGSDGVLNMRVVAWGKHKLTAANTIATGTSGVKYGNSVVSTSAFKSPVVRVEVGAGTDMGTLSVSNLQTPLTIQMAFTTPSTSLNTSSVWVTCPGTSTRNISVTCRDSEGLLSQTLNISCHVSATPYRVDASTRCPIIGRCAFWNTTLGAWSTNGCKTVASSGGSSTCLCTHLSFFTPVAVPLQTLASLDNLFVNAAERLKTEPMTRAVAAAVLVVYLLFLVALGGTIHSSVLRRRQFLRRTRMSALYGEVLTLALADAEGGPHALRAATGAKDDGQAKTSTKAKTLTPRTVKRLPSGTQPGDVALERIYGVDVEAPGKAAARIVEQRMFRIQRLWDSIRELWYSPHKRVADEESSLRTTTLVLTRGQSFLVIFVTGLTVLWLSAVLYDPNAVSLITFVKAGQHVPMALIKLRLLEAFFRFTVSVPIGAVVGLLLVGE